MYNHALKSNDQYLAKAQPLPHNTSVQGNKGTQNFSGTLGNVELLLTTEEEITLASGNSMTVTLEHSSDSISYTELGRLINLSGEKTIAPRTILGRFIPPTNTKKYTRAVITCTGPAATGRINIYPHYLAR